MIKELEDLQNITEATFLRFALDNKLFTLKDMGKYFGVSRETVRLTVNYLGDDLLRKVRDNNKVELFKAKYAIPNKTYLDLDGNPQIEQWVAIENVNNLYISNMGRVKRLYTKSVAGIPVQYFIITKYSTKSAYLKTRIDDTTLYIHRLVGKAFLKGETEERCCINHLDGDKHNNVVTNLQWVTYAENTKHCIEVLKRHGSITRKLKSKAKNGTC